MRFDVYCDESRPDVLCSKVGKADHLVIGSLWLPSEEREALKRMVHELRNKHRVGGEFKWQKVSPSRLGFYEDLVSAFFSEGDRLRFRCIAVDRKKVDLVKYHDSDQELGFYKFYYQLLHHWILDFNEYAVLCDHKQNRDMTRLPVLQACLQNSNLSAQIRVVQAVRSEESVLVQFTDVLSGIVGARLNASLNAGSAKSRLVEFLESRLGRLIGPTPKSEAKFNVFGINPGGGW